jgi:hypothetical protein
MYIMLDKKTLLNLIRVLKLFELLSQGIVTKSSLFIHLNQKEAPY